MWFGIRTGKRSAAGLLVLVVSLIRASIPVSSSSSAAAAAAAAAGMATAGSMQPIAYSCQPDLPRTDDVAASTAELDRVVSADSIADAARETGASAPGHRLRRGAGPCTGSHRPTAPAASYARETQQDSPQLPVGTGAAAAAAGVGVGYRAAPSGRHTAGGESEHVGAGNTTAGTGGDVVIPFPGEHDTGHDSSGGSGKEQSGDGKDPKPSPSNDTLHTAPAEFTATAADVTAVVSTAYHTDTDGHADAGISNWTTAGQASTSDARTTSHTTSAASLASTANSGAGNATALQLASSASGADQASTAEPQATDATTALPAKPTKPPAEDVTEPKLPPKTPPTVNSTSAGRTGQPNWSTAVTGQQGPNQTLPSPGSPVQSSSPASGSEQSTTAVATASPPSSAATAGTGSTSARPTARSEPSALISMRMRMSREKFCCVVDEFRATMLRVMAQANVPNLSKTQVRIVDIDDEQCPHDQCPQVPPESAAGAGSDEDDDGSLLLLQKRRLGRLLAPADSRLPQRLRRQQLLPADYLKSLGIIDSFVVTFYLSSDADSSAASKELTKLCYDSLTNDGGREVIAKSSLFNGMIEEVLYKSEDDYASKESETEQSSNQSMVVVIALAAVAGACLAALALLQMVILRRRKGQGRSMRASQRRSAAEDGQSVQSLPASIAALRRSLRRSFRGSDSTQRSFAFVNVAMQTEKDAMSNPMSFSKLASRSLEVDYLEEEFKTIPTNLPRMSQMQHGWANKNRFANIIPLEVTRVKLQASDIATDYINANYVSSYRGQSRAYIAAQSPMRNTVNDFWRMVWEQQSQVIVALMSLVGDGQPRCSDYLPDASGIDNVKVFGQFQVTAQRQVAAQDYVFCIVSLKNLDGGLVRQVVHFHYTAWPAKGVPESAARLIKFIADLRPYMEVSQGPTVVHCSTGTGKTGTLIAVDIGMQAYDDSKTIDVMNLVYRIRKERAGAVQTKEQYAFVYKALLEYAAECASSCSGSASLASERGSRLSLHECQNEL